jgi:hypothetical protein
MAVIEKGDIGTLDAIRNMKQVDNQQVVTMQNFMNKYIDSGVHICRHCSAQVRHAHNRIINWANNNSQAIETVRNEGICITCGIELQDKRRKYCSDACKEIHKNGNK